MSLDDSLAEASDDFRDEVARTLRLWAERRLRDANDQPDLDWYYEVRSAASVLGLDSDDGPTFVCDACGRLADVLDAAGACADSWFEVDLGAVGLRTALRQNALIDGEAIRPATLQSLFGWSFEDSVVALRRAEQRGLLSRKGKLYVFAPATCDRCLRQRAEANETPPDVRGTELSARERIPPQLRFRVLQRDAFRCQYCGRSARDGATLHLDHVIPVSAGGETAEGNLITSCELCNLGKSTSYVV